MPAKHAEPDAGRADDGRLKLRYAGWLVQQLGAQLYPSVTAAVAELISNAWDANAEHVWVSIPFDSWTRGTASIEVIDDGEGMDREEAQEKYLVVGRRRREDEQSDRTSGGKRPLHGRKGIGKLAAFGTAGTLDCITVKGTELTAFRLEYDILRKMKPGVEYPVEDPPDQTPPTHPDTGEPLDTGTRIVLSDLNVKRRPNKDRFMESMSRRFSLSTNDMTVMINGERLEPFDYPGLEIRFPRDGIQHGSERLNGWARDRVPDGKGVLQDVDWWIGFAHRPLEDETMQGVSVVTHGKLAQRPFTFDLGRGVSGQLGLEYMVGEVRADWLDDGWRSEDDVIASDRDRLQLDSEELRPFKQWGQNLIRWALRQRNAVRTANASEELDAAIRSVLDRVSAPERTRLRQIALRLVEFELSASVIADLLELIMRARADQAATEALAHALEAEDPADPRVWQALEDADRLAAATAHSVASGRRRFAEMLLEYAEDRQPLDGLLELTARNAWIADVEAGHARSVPAAAAPDGILGVIEAEHPDGPLRIALTDLDARLDRQAVEAITAASTADGRLLVIAGDIDAAESPATTWTALLTEAAARQRMLEERLAKRLSGRQR